MCINLVNVVHGTYEMSYLDICSSRNDASIFSTRLTSLIIAKSYSLRPAKSSENVASPRPAFWLAYRRVCGAASHKMLCFSPSYQFQN
jgi:hypothetical protein